ncbi:hypothetical protein DFH11DRAFT_1321541 [Phellopilus nigrolimitatus]|nr:hypothetical protein DFH11DRAFT_1321541 [Phellopilus nigrolimitatus]
MHATRVLFCCHPLLLRPLYPSTSTPFAQRNSPPLVLRHVKLARQDRGAWGPSRPLDGRGDTAGSLTAMATLASRLRTDKRRSVRLVLVCCSTRRPWLLLFGQNFSGYAAWTSGTKKPGACERMIVVAAVRDVDFGQRTAECVRVAVLAAICRQHLHRAWAHFAIDRSPLFVEIEACRIRSRASNNRIKAPGHPQTQIIRVLEIGNKRPGKNKAVRSLTCGSVCYCALRKISQ